MSRVEEEAISSSLDVAVGLPPGDQYTPRSLREGKQRAYRSSIAANNHGGSNEGGKEWTEERGHDGGARRWLVGLGSTGRKRERGHRDDLREINDRNDRASLWETRTPCLGA